jgi:aldose 1-epimerase
LLVKKEFFGKLNDGREAQLYTLVNKNGLRLLITNFGGRMVQLWTPNRDGRFDDIITGFDSLDPYLIRNPYFGALVGRYATRINNSAFTLNGKTYNLDPNQAPNHLHGGAKGFSNLLWDAEPLEEDGGGKLELTLTSPDGDQGYPGKLEVKVIYTLGADNSLSIKYFAKTDADTVVNLTNHVYFNLKGHNSGDILGHRIRIAADEYLPSDSADIPLGGPAKVEGTPFDLRAMTEIGSRIHSSYEQIAQKLGFDVHYCLDDKKELRKVCEVEEPEQGRGMEVRTTKPGIVFYTANKIKDNFTFVGKGAYVYKQYCGFCLETQYPPDGPNGPYKDSVILRPGEEYCHETVFSFTCK